MSVTKQEIDDLQKKCDEFAEKAQELDNLTGNTNYSTDIRSYIGNTIIGVIDTVHKYQTARGVLVNSNYVRELNNGNKNPVDTEGIRATFDDVEKKVDTLTEIYEACLEKVKK